VRTEIDYYTEVEQAHIPTAVAVQRSFRSHTLGSNLAKNYMFINQVKHTVTKSRSVRETIDSISVSSA